MTNKEDVLLVSLNEYLKAGVHIGTKFSNEFMKKFIYKTKPNGLKIMNIQQINNRLRIGGKFLANYNPEKILVVCRREMGHYTIRKFGEVTGCRVIVGRYLPGTLTNPDYPYFFEPDIIILCDPWTDRQAMKDALVVNIPIISLVGSNNSLENIDYAIPCNNKSGKSLPLVFYILAREFLKNKGIIEKNEEFEYSINDFSSPEEEK